jgi:hypothetical protein
MDARDKFSQFVAEFVSPALKAEGFHRKGLTFYVFEHGNWGVINFQKGWQSTPDGVNFTVNLGIALAALSPLPEDKLRKWRPREYDCDWRERLGILLTGDDTWWVIQPTTDVIDLARQILGTLRNRGIPEIKRYIRAEDLRDLWLSGRSPGLTNLQRLRKLGVLLRKLGPAELVARIEADAEVAGQEATLRRAQEELAAVLIRAGFTPVDGSNTEFHAPNDWQKRLSDTRE